MCCYQQFTAVRDFQVVYLFRGNEGSALARKRLWAAGVHRASVFALTCCLIATRGQLRGLSPACGGVAAGRRWGKAGIQGVA